MKLHTALFIAPALLIGGLGAQTLSLAPHAWEKQLTLPSGVTPAQAAQFSENGHEISIGPYLAGNAAARLEYAKPLPPREAAIEGKFRTNNLYPHEALVRVTFKKGKDRLSTLNYPLGVAAQWEAFNIPIVKAPTGADSVAVSFGLTEKTNGQVRFTALRITSPYRTPDFPVRHSPLTRPAPPASLKPGQFVRLEKSGNTWWLVDTNGKPFFSVGSVTPKDVYPQLQKLGFNSFASNHDILWWSAFNDRQLAQHAPVLFQFHTVGTNVGDAYDTLVDASGANPGSSQAQAMKGGGFNHAFPDPFDPRWEASLRKKVHESAVLFHDKPYYAGWMADNERHHQDIFRYVWSTHCAEHFRGFLEHKYSSIAALNQAWKSNFASFDALIAARPDPLIREGAMYEDFRLFSREILRTYNSTILRIIHQEDPGRLVFTNRFMIGEARDVFENLDLYSGYDAIAVNAYPSNLSAGMAPGEREYLTLLHERTGKPLLVTEWSVPARDSGLYENYAHLDWSFPQTVATQQQRARQAAEYLAQLYDLPFVIGAHWFTWSDIDTKERQANRGLFKANNQPWTELQEALAGVIRDMRQ
jgi:hypothetical protein